MISIFTGVTGLRAHQRAVDVIANNIANVNTIGYKAGRASFQEALSQTIRGAYSASGGQGGANPIQVGLGVHVASIDNLMTQGNLKATGRVLDIAIEGNGFFAVSDGVSNYIVCIQYKFKLPILVIVMNTRRGELVDELKRVKHVSIWRHNPVSKAHHIVDLNHMSSIVPNLNPVNFVVLKVYSQLWSPSCVSDSILCVPNI